MNTGAVLISDSPMTLGIQFILGYLLGQPELANSCRLKGLLTSAPNFTALETPHTEQERFVLLRYLDSEKPSVIGISSTERTRTRSLDLLPLIGQYHPDALMVAGGIDAIAAPLAYLNRGVDLVVNGDGEIPMKLILQSLLAGKTRAEIRLCPPPGCFTMEFRNPGPAETPGSLPLPYYGQRLQKLTSQGVLPSAAIAPAHIQFIHRRNAIDMFTQRGCTHKCKFCAQDLRLVYEDSPFRNSRKLTPSQIVRFLESLRRENSFYEFVYFWDLDFLRRSKSELEEFARQYREHIGLPFFIFVTEKSVNAVEADTIATLVAAGLKTINMGIQSGSNRILHSSYGRGNTAEETRRAIAVLHSATRDSDVELLYDVITHNPEETSADILETMRLVAEIPTDGRQEIHLNTHRLDFNTGQDLRSGDTKSRATDYQDFVASDTWDASLDSPYLSILLGKLMRGKLTPTTIGSVRRDHLDQLIARDFVSEMDRHRPILQIFLDALVPQESQPFVERWASGLEPKDAPAATEFPVIHLKAAG